jgi:serralysin
MAGDDGKNPYIATIFDTPKGGLFGGYLDGAALTDPNVAALIMDYRWTTTYLGPTPASVIRYAFPSDASDYQIFPAPNTVNPVSQVPITDFQKAAVVASLALISSYTEVTFVEVASGTAVDATLRFAQTTSGGGGSHARFPSNNGNYTHTDSRDAGDNFLGTNGNPPDEQFHGTDHFNSIMHELGHSLGLKHGHDRSHNGSLSGRVNDNEFSVMTYASYLGSPDVDKAPTEARLGSSPQSYMMYDIAALQALYGANFSKAGTADLYTWDPETGQLSINGVHPTGSGTTATQKIFSTVWTMGAAATYDLSMFTEGQVDDLRPGHWLTFARDKLADLNSNKAAGAAGFQAQGNIYNALLYNDDLSSAVVKLVTGSGNDALIGNDRDNILIANGGNDILVAAGGNDTLSGGAGADTFYFGPGHSIVRDTVADLNGDVMRDFGHTSIDILGVRVGRDSLTITPGMTTVTAGESSFQLEGNFSGNGEFMVSPRGTGTDAHTTVSFVNYLPTLAEGVAVNPTAINGVANQAFLTGDGTLRFTLELKSAVSAFANSLGVYKIGADGTIFDVHVLFTNTLTVASGARSIDLGTPGNGERIGFFLIQDGADRLGGLPDNLSFVTAGGGAAANLDSGLPPVLFSATRGKLDATIFHSFAGINPGAAEQVLAGVAPGGRELQIGFEDLPSATGDRDFQDVVIGIHLNGNGFLLA